MPTPLDWAAKILPAGINVGKNGAAQDWTTMGMGLTSDIGGIAKLYLKNTDRFGEASKKFFGGNAVILEWGINVITVVEQLLGLVSPDKGVNFRLSNKEYLLAYEQLKSVVPGDGWQGSASEAYDAKNDALCALVKQMAELDALMVTILATQAGQVTYTRRVLALTKTTLTIAIPIALALLLIKPPGTGEMASYAFQMLCAVGAIIAVVSVLGEMLDHAFDNKSKLDELAGEYDAVAAAAVLTPSGKPSTSSDAAQASSPAGLPSMTNSSSTFSGSGDRHAPVTARTAITGDGESPGDGSPANRVDPATPEISAVSGMPTVGELSKQAGMGSAQRIAASARRGTRTGAAVEGKVALTGDIEGAAAGAAEIERAPIDFATIGASQAYEPAPAEK